MQYKNDSVGKMGEILAMLFAIMADGIITHCGEIDGKQIIRDAIYRFGYERGKAIRDMVLKDNKEITFENLEKYYDIPENNGWDSDSIIIDNKMREYTRYCPFAKKWNEMNMTDIGSMYCAVDESIMIGYFEDVDFERVRIFNKNNEGHCEMTVTPK